MNTIFSSQPKKKPAGLLSYKYFPSQKQLTLTGLAAGSSLCLLMLGVLATNAQELSHSPQPKGTPTATLFEKQESLFDIAQLESYEGLAVGEVVMHSVSDARGTIVFIPQYHRNPSSAVEDNSNDASYRAQKEIYGIIKTLREKAGIDTVMIEGEMHGPVEDASVGQLRATLTQKDKLASLRQALAKVFEQETLDRKRENRVLKYLDKKVSELDRMVVLKGAPQQLVAEGVDLQLIGVENAETLTEGREIIRNYVYARDRLAQVEESSTASDTQKIAQKPDAKVQALLALLTQESTGSISKDMRYLHAAALDQNNVPAANLLAEVEDALAQAPVKRVSRTATKNDVPSRADNPYKSVTDVNRLKEEMRVIEADIQKTVIDRRNEETAQSVAHSLRSEQEGIGILQFGAGHREGLIKELNEQGLSVVVVTPTEVFNKTLGE